MQSSCNFSNYFYYTFCNFWRWFPNKFVKLISVNFVNTLTFPKNIELEMSGLACVSNLATIHPPYVSLLLPEDIESIIHHASRIGKAYSRKNISNIEIICWKIISDQTSQRILVGRPLSWRWYWMKIEGVGSCQKHPEGHIISGPSVAKSSLK